MALSFLSISSKDTNTLSMILTTSIVFLLIDAIYLSSASNHFNILVTKIQGSSLKLDYLATFFTYIALIFGIYWFILRERKSILKAFIYGIVVYAVYEFTNKAIFKQWSWGTVAMDTLWGGILHASTVYLVYKMYGIK